MTPTDELVLIERDIDAARKRILLDRKFLGDQLAPLGADIDTVDGLLSELDEFGAPHVLNRLAQNSARHGLGAPSPQLLTTVGALLEQLADTSYQFDTLVGARETILSEANPGRRRVYPWFGREFAFDPRTAKLRFLDGQSPLETATLEAVPNKIAPSQNPDAGPARQTKRRRSMEP